MRHGYLKGDWGNLIAFVFVQNESGPDQGAALQTHYGISKSKSRIRIGIGHVIVEVRIVRVFVRLVILPTFITHHALRLALFINEDHGMAFTALGTLLAHGLKSANC